MSGQKTKTVRFDRKAMDSMNLDSYITELLKFKQELLDDGFDPSNTNFQVPGSFTIISKRDFTPEELKKVEIEKIQEKINSIKILKDSYTIIINSKQHSIDNFKLSFKNTVPLNAHDKERKKEKLQKLVDRLDTYVFTVQNIESFLNEFQNNFEDISLDFVNKFYDDSKKFVESK